MIIGYARVSTDEQNMDLQIQALEKAGCHKIFEDHGFSGIQLNRPQLKEAIGYLQKGDILVVWKLDRLGRSLAHLVEMIRDFANQGIQFKSLTENIDTTSPGGTLIFHIMAAMAQFERDLIGERTKAGLESAKRRGELLGRRKKLNKARSDVVMQLLAENKTAAEIAQIMQVAVRTVYYEISRRKNLQMQY